MQRNEKRTFSHYCTSIKAISLYYLNFLQISSGISKICYVFNGVSYAHQACFDQKYRKIVIVWNIIAISNIDFLF